MYGLTENYFETSELIYVHARQIHKVCCKLVNDSDFEDATSFFHISHESKLRTTIFLWCGSKLRIQV